MKLPTLSEVVFKTIEKYTGLDKLGGVAKALHIIHTYAKFLKQPLKLEMFIPCKDGVPLEEPYDLDVNVFDNLNNKEQNDWLNEQKEYQKAKERVIFKGFEMLSEVKDKYLISNEDAFEIIIYKNGNFWEYKQISDLCEKVELTESEHKRLGL